MYSTAQKKTFSLTFPENYGNKELAGKEAQFELECVSVEAPHYPAGKDKFAKSLAVESVEVLKTEIRSNIEREVQERLYDRNRTEGRISWKTDWRTLSPGILRNALPHRRPSRCRRGE